MALQGGGGGADVQVQGDVGVAKLPGEPVDQALEFFLAGIEAARCNWPPGRRRLRTA